MKPVQLTLRETAGLCRSLALYLHAGMRMGEGLFLLSQEQTEPLKGLYAGLGRQLDSGMLLSQAMEQTGAFPSQLMAMVRVGEATGRMEEALNALAEQAEVQEQSRRQLRLSLTYPLMILLLMLAVIGVLLTKVLPVFDAVYASLGGGLTGVAGALLGLGDVLRAALPGLFVLGVLAALLALVLCLWEPARRKAEALWHRVQGDRGLARKFHNARFAQGLSMGLSAGLPLEEAASLAAGLLEDIPAARERALGCAATLAQGADLSEGLGQWDLLPPADCRMLALGLGSGCGDRVMEDIARRLMEDALEAQERRAARIEPALVLGASLLVGAILLSVMLPLMDLLTLMG